MDALSYIQSDIEEQSVACDVLRDDGGGYNGGNYSKVDTIDVAIHSPSSSSEVVVEGSGEETSLTGKVVPDYDSNGNLLSHVQVNDRLRPQEHSGKLYEVRVKDGVPNELNPDIWRLGLEHANSSN